MPDIKGNDKSRETNGIDPVTMVLYLIRQMTFCTVCFARY